MRDIKIEIINTTKQIGDLADWLILRHASPELYKPTMYIDLEGVNLCREGSLSILTLLIDTGNPSIRVCLIDVYLLGSQAFNTTGIKGKTLKNIFQDENIPKIFFDVRNDSDALFAHFDIALQGVQDVQLMESATRKTTSSRKYLNGLAKCIEQFIPYSSDLTSWKLAKEKGGRLFNPKYGGSYKIFKQRPIPKEIISYCVGDVQYLPELWSKFQLNTDRWRDLVNKETKKRVEASQKPEYQPRGPNRTLAPWSVDQNRTLDEWNYALLLVTILMNTAAGIPMKTIVGLTTARPAVGTSSTIGTTTITIPTRPHSLITKSVKKISACIRTIGACCDVIEFSCKRAFHVCLLRGQHLLHHALACVSTIFQ